MCYLHEICAAASFLPLLQMRRDFGADNRGDGGPPATTWLLDDFAWNNSVLIERIDGAHSVIAVCDDELSMS